MKLLLVDDDPIFRLGFSTALTQETAWTIAAKPFDEILQDNAQRDAVDLVLCDPGWQADRLWLRYLELQEIYPDQPIVLFTSQLDTERLAQAKRDGINGYFPKGMAITDLVPNLENVVAGHQAWSQRPKSRNQNIFAIMRRRGLNDIYTTLDDLEAYLLNENVSKIKRLVFEGRCRELNAAAWVVRQLLPQGTSTIEKTVTQPLPAPSTSEPTLAETGEITTTNQLWQTLLEQTYIKLNRSLENATSITLETDILSVAKRRELYHIILQQLTQILNDPQWQNCTPEKFAIRQRRSLRNLWKFSTQEFIARHNPSEDTQSEFFTNLLNQEAIAINEATFQNLPYGLELFQYLIQEKPFLIDNVEYRIESKESLERAQKILENLLIQMANSTMQFVLNTFSELEIFKYHLYNFDIRSSREIARFRNDLSWQYRRNRYWLEPKAIFESRYQLLELKSKGICQTFIYAPRHQELDQLRGVAWGVTILLEFRDALAPRVRSLVGWLGNILVYFLTNVVGRALGLIARGISDGVGSSWKKTKKRSFIRSENIR